MQNEIKNGIRKKMVERTRRLWKNFHG